MIVPDLNLLVYAHSTESTLHQVARKWWESITIGRCLVVCFGGRLPLTHPAT